MSAGARFEWWRADLTPAVRESSREPGRGVARAGDGSEVPFWALLAFTIVLVAAPQAFLPALAPLRLGLLTAALATTAYLFDRFMNQRPILRVSPVIAAAAGLAAWAILTAPFSYWPGGSLSVLLDAFSKTLAIFCLLAHVVVTRPRLRRAVWGLALTALPLAVFGLREYLAGRFADAGPVKRIVSYEAPLTQNPNDLALMLNLVLPVTLALALVQERSGARLFLLGCVALDALAIIATFSRAGFLTLATTGVIYGARLLRRPGRAWVLAALALLLLSLPWLPHGYVDRLATIADVDADPTGSAQERWGSTVAALRLVAENPILGAGIGMNILALNEERGAIWKEVHNVYLEYAVDLGLPGLALFLVILVGCFRATAFVMRRTSGARETRDLFLLAEGIQVSLAAFAVAALFHPVAYHFYFFYFAGLALAARTACEAV